jgi:succinate dehydrogenase / fumarate reductase, flavoprotein subunit
LRICELGLGVDGGMQVFLDVTHLSAKVQHKMESVLDIYRKFTGDDPHRVPMKIFPAVHYSMGGAWVDWPAADDPDRMQRFRQMTNIPGCFNIGESDFQYHGANRLGANSLLSCIFGGLVAGMEVPRYLETLSASYGNLPSRIFAGALTEEEALKEDLMTRDGKENVHRLHDELADVMVKNVTVKRNNADLGKAMQMIQEIRERFKRIRLDDRGSNVNQTYVFASQFGPMLEIALVITKGALLRDEFRGSHYKPEFPQRDDENWLKTSIATYDPNRDDPVIDYVPVDLRYLKPIARDYSKAKKVIPHFENVPTNIKLPV